MRPVWQRVCFRWTRTLVKGTIEILERLMGRLTIEEEIVRIVMKWREIARVNWNGMIIWYGYKQNRMMRVKTPFNSNYTGQLTEVPKVDCSEFHCRFCNFRFTTLVSNASFDCSRPVLSQNCPLLTQTSIARDSFHSVFCKTIFSLQCKIEIAKYTCVHVLRVAFKIYSAPNKSLTYC